MLCLPILISSGVAIARHLLQSTPFSPTLLLKSGIRVLALTQRDSVIIAEVNADEETELATRFDITGFPTLKYFPAGAADEPIDYDGQRTADDLTRWTNEHAGGFPCLLSSVRYPCDSEKAGLERVCFDSFEL